jgi:hypothetical protein
MNEWMNEWMRIDMLNIFDIRLLLWYALNDFCMSPENWDFRSQDQIFRETSDKMQSTWLQLAKFDSFNQKKVTQTMTFILIISQETSDFFI